MADDRFRATWRRHFSLMLHPHVPVLQSLVEATDKLDAALGFLEPLSPGMDVELEQGLVVASLAIEYALKLLDHHGLIDGPDPPMPVNLAQAKQAVGNLLIFVRESVELAQIEDLGSAFRGLGVSLCFLFFLRRGLGVSLCFSERTWGQPLFFVFPEDFGFRVHVARFRVFASSRSATTVLIGLIGITSAAVPIIQAPRPFPMRRQELDRKIPFRLFRRHT